MPDVSGHPAKLSRVNDKTQVNCATKGHVLLPPLIPVLAFCHALLGNAKHLQVSQPEAVLQPQAVLVVTCRENQQRIFACLCGTAGNARQLQKMDVQSHAPVPKRDVSDLYRPTAPSKFCFW